MTTINVHITASAVDLSGLCRKDPFHQQVIDGLIREHSKRPDHQMTTNDALELAAFLRGGLPPINKERGTEYAKLIEARVHQAKN